MNWKTKAVWKCKNCLQQKEVTVRCRKKMLLTNKLTVSTENCCNKKVETAKPGIILKTGWQKNIKPTSQPKTATKKQKHCNLRYEMKSSNLKKYKPTATEKNKGFRILSEPTATKNTNTKS